VSTPYTRPYTEKVRGCRNGTTPARSIAGAPSLPPAGRAVLPSRLLALRRAYCTLRYRMKTPTLILSLCLLLLALPTSAADWPQWQGPERNNVSKETGLLKNWPKKGPPLLWAFKNAGIGFSGPAIAGDRLYIMGARKDAAGQEVEYLLALDVNKKGKEVWSAKIGPIFTFKGNSWGDGPRGTPTVDGDRVYALGGQGILICVKAANGQELWR